MADKIYPHFKKRAMDGAIDLDGDTFFYALLKDTYAYAATQRLWAGVSGDEISASGYTAGGSTLTGVTWVRVGGTVTFNAVDIAWAAMTGTARYGVIYDGTAASDPLVCLQDFGSNKSVSAGTFTVIFNADGIFTLT